MQGNQNQPGGQISPETNANSEAGNPGPGAPSTTEQRQDPPRADTGPKGRPAPGGRADAPPPDANE